MKCGRRDIAIAKMAGGDLSEWRAALLQRHLDACPRCAAMHMDLVSQRAASLDAHSEVDTVDGSFVAIDVLAQLDARDPSSRRISGRMAVGVAIASMFIGMFLVQRQLSAPFEQDRALLTKTSTDTNSTASIVAAQTDTSATQHSDVVIQMVTNNPDVVIYWLGGSAGG